MDFVGPLNFANPVSQNQGTEEQRRAFAAERLGRPTRIRDARATHGVLAEATDSAELLANGCGFLLVHAPSAVKDWTDIAEVAEVYYEESRVLLQEPPARSHGAANHAVIPTATSRSRSTTGSMASSTVPARRPFTTTTRTR